MLLNCVKSTASKQHHIVCLLISMNNNRILSIKHLPMTYTKVNNYTGWIAFIIASLTYILTLEPSASFWDCGEFIACIYRLQVAHQPGAPLFTMIGKVFTLLSMGDNTKVAYWANFASALASGATIMFLFWTITALAKKAVVKIETELTATNLVLIIGAGLVG